MHSGGFQQARAQSQLCLIQLTAGLRCWKMERMLHYIFWLPLGVWLSPAQTLVIQALSFMHWCKYCSLGGRLSHFQTAETGVGTRPSTVPYLCWWHSISISVDHKFLYMRTTSCYFGLSPPKVITVCWGMMWLLLRIVLPVTVLTSISPNANTWLYRGKERQQLQLPQYSRKVYYWRGLSCLSTLVLLFPQIFPGQTT